MMNLEPLFWLTPTSAILALIFAFFFFRWMMAKDEGTETMQRIAAHVRAGARAYLSQQYRVVAVVFVILALVFCYMAYGLRVQNPWVPFAFVTGGFFSALAGYFGMRTATYASNRAAAAAQESLNAALVVAFRSGAVMGLVVVGLALLDISIWFLVLNHFIGDDGIPGQKLVIITTTMLTFGQHFGVDP